MDSLLDFKRGLKLLWAEAAQGQMPSLEASLPWPLKNPYRPSDPISDVLTHLILEKIRQTGSPKTDRFWGVPPPFIPRTLTMPVSELCQLALLWACAGEKEAASALASSIPLDFPWMWCRENEYSEEEALASISLLSQAMGNRAEERFGAPYFKALSKQLQKIDFSKSSLIDWTLIEADNLRCCLSFSGNRTSIGALSSDSAEIRAFGPQSFPLSDSLGFGIRRVLQHENRWASFAASPEVWFEIKPRTENGGIFFDLTFFGLKPNIPLAFSFYVKASSAQIGSEKLKPKTLQRYQGVSKPLRFGQSLSIESLIPGKMEVIPLAGGGGYWDCEYLTAFEIHPINAKMAFSVHTASS